MNEVGNFNIQNNKIPANKNITVVFSPSANVKEYTYKIYDKEKIIKQSNLLKYETIIELENSGTYHIEINAILHDGSSQIINSENLIIDKEKPVINVKSSVVEITKNNQNAIYENATAKDNIDGNIKVRVDQSTINLNTYKAQTVTYTAIDRAGNIATKRVNVIVKPNESYVFAFRCLALAVILILIYTITNLVNALKLEKRVEKFTVKSLKAQNISFSEKAITIYQDLTKKISKKFSNFELSQKYCQKLEKYLPVTSINKTKEDIFAGKIITGILFVITAIIVKIIKFKLITIYEIVLIFTFGFFVLDILYFIKYKVFRWKLESDFIAAITIMNNSFKSGRSITQAIDTVASELKGPIGKEFNRMSLELLYGLGIDVVFKRFAERIDLEEANYLTASLTILNKTGGDIIKVFNSIERSMFDKRKLRLELSSLTSGSRIVVAVLLGMPFFFVLVISLINPDYFIPFFTTTIGICLLIFMLIYYIIFVVVVRKVMKVVI